MLALSWWQSISLFVVFGVAQINLAVGTHMLRPNLGDVGAPAGGFER